MKTYKVNWNATVTYSAIVDVPDDATEDDILNAVEKRVEANDYTEDFEDYTPKFKIEEVKDV